jgi:hypothetical protein
MPPAIGPVKSYRGQPFAGVVYRRELLFWLLLLPAFAALGSPRPRREFVGQVETCAFLVVAATSMGRRKRLALSSSPGSG